MQLFRRSCFMVLLREFLSLLRAEDVRFDSPMSQVPLLTAFFWHRCFHSPKFLFGVATLPLPPCSAAYGTCVSRVSSEISNVLTLDLKWSENLFLCVVAYGRFVSSSLFCLFRRWKLRIKAGFAIVCNTLHPEMWSEALCVGLNLIHEDSNDYSQMLPFI